MAVATMGVLSQSQFSISVLAGVLLAAFTFAASAALASSVSDRSAAAGLAIQLGGFVMRLSLVAVALFVCTRYAHLEPTSLGAGLAGGFTVLTLLAAARELRRHRLGRTR